jgi:6-phosphogluconate dehydrogenase
MASCDIGLIGLGVMGQNLVLNMARNGFKVAVYNRTSEKTTEFLNGTAANNANISAAFSLEELANMLNRPRKIMLMVKAGKAIDAVLDELQPLLEPGDMVIDGGNSLFRDTEARVAALSGTDIHFLGVGISGGEEGALWGPSIMPGGDMAAYQQVAPIFNAIAAKVQGDPCVTHLGPLGAGHYVKMVHNGIEYGVMQLIAETYDVLHRGLGLNASQLHAIFTEWNQAELASYLMEITASIFSKMDEKTGQPLVELILDKAGQKGTGKWTGQDAFDIGYPIPTINAALAARILSAYKTERQQAGIVLTGPQPGSDVNDRTALPASARGALYTATLITYAQGFGMLRTASQEYDYHFNYGDIARIWRGGCIIRAAFLDDIRAAFAAEPELPNLLLAPFFKEAINNHQDALRHIVQFATRFGIPVPALSASLAWYDGYRSATLPANLIQAQRDFFGAHTYERIDQAGIFHTQWEE